MAVAAWLKGFIGDQVEIELSGGVLRVELDGHGSVWLEGPTEEVYRGEWWCNQ